MINFITRHFTSLWAFITSPFRAVWRMISRIFPPREFTVMDTPRGNVYTFNQSSFWRFTRFCGKIGLFLWAAWSTYVFVYHRPLLQKRTQQLEEARNTHDRHMSELKTYLTKYNELVRDLNVIDDKVLNSNKLKDSEKEKLSFMGGISMSKKKQIKSEEKIRIAKAYIKGEIGIREAGRLLGVDHHSVENWIRLYETEGVKAFMPQAGTRQYDPAVKEAAVKDYLAGKGGLRNICKIYKIRSTHQLSDWIKVYNSHKDFKKQTGGSRMTKGRETTQAERIAVAKACIANGKNYGEVAIQHNVSYQQARSWTFKYIEGGESALEDRRGQRKKDQQPRTELEQAQIEIEQLKHKLKMLEMENHLLKKLEEIERRRG